MLRAASYDVVFREIPGEVTLAVNIAGCPNRCPGCHSSHLQEDAGESLDDELLEGLLAQYGGAATCVCLMGGDADPAEVARIAGRIRAAGLKAAWYSGREALPDGFPTERLDYVKLGPYVEALGGLDSPGTNQRLYRVSGGRLEDITGVFWR